MRCFRSEVSVFAVTKRQDIKKKSLPFSLQMNILKRKGRLFNELENNAFGFVLVLVLVLTYKQYYESPHVVIALLRRATLQNALLIIFGRRKSGDTE